MRDKKRIDRILNQLKELWNKYPDQRFFQLLYNYTRIGTMKDPFYYEDDELEKQLEKQLVININYNEN